MVAAERLDPTLGTTRLTTRCCRLYTAPPTGGGLSGNRRGAGAGLSMAPSVGLFECRDPLDGDLCKSRSMRIEARDSTDWRSPWHD